MYHSRFTSVNYSGNQYRDLSRYYGILPGQVGTVTGSNGETQSIPIPAFAPPMSQQTVPTYHVDYIGTPMDLMHGLRADELTSGYFPVNNAYSSSCTTFRKRGCDGVVPQNQIPIPDRCPGCGGPGLAPCPCGPGAQLPVLPGVPTPAPMPIPAPCVRDSVGRCSINRDCINRDLDQPVHILPYNPGDVISGDKHLEQRNFAQVPSRVGNLSYGTGGNTAAAPGMLG